MESQALSAEFPTDPDSTSVRVAVRIRPQSAKEKAEMNHICTTVIPNNAQIVIGKDATFTYDHVFNINTPQDCVFQTLAKPLVDGCMDGYNATIIAYGQTGSGKTYTMGTGFDIGCSHADVGLIPRAVQYLFACITKRRAEAATKKEPVPEFKVVAQFLELYNEELVDLLDSERVRKPHLRLHENAQGDIYLTGVSTRLVSSLDDTLKCLHDGTLVRSTASTNMNAQSSRSHAIFTLHIRQQKLLKYENSNEQKKSDTQSGVDVDPDSTVVDQVPEYETLTAKFHFVDLAGSERLKRTGATGDRAKEGISINRGLLALGNVISALGDKSKRGCHVPYRDSKLTRLLQDSLGGNSRTIMIACISPSDCDFLETLNTLKYANRARNIRNRVIMNQDKTSKQLATLRAQLAALEEELNEYRQGKRLATSNGTESSSDLSREMVMLQSENNKLRLRVKALAVTVDALKVRNAQLLADQETCSWATLKSRMMGVGRHDKSDDQNSKAESDKSYLGLISADAEDFRHLVEKYTVEVEELRTKLAEAEALVEFSQRPYTHTSSQVGRLSGRPLTANSSSSKIDSTFSSTRVALTNGEFPDLDSSLLSAAEAGLSAANKFFDNDELTVDANAFECYPLRIRKSRRKKRHINSSQSEERKPLKSKMTNVAAFSDIENSKSSNSRRRGRRTLLSNDTDSTAIEGLCDEDRENENDSENVEDETLLGNDATELSDSCSDSDSKDSIDENILMGSMSDHTSDKPQCGLKEARLHQSLAHVSSEIDTKQRLIAELQSKAAELNHLKNHYERQMASLLFRIKETERERDSIIANLGQIEHSGEERLKRTREEFEKKLSILQEEVSQLHLSRQEQIRLERQQSKKNEELRLLRQELEQLRKYKIDLTKRLREETQRTRHLEALSAKRVMELKKAKSQADNQIKTLEAAHSAKDRALQQKQAELDVLRRKNIEQQRQLSSSFSGRMSQSVLGMTSTGWGSLRKPIGRSSLSNSMYGRHRIFGTAKAKWTLVSQELDASVERHQKSARLEHDLQTWLRERECLGRRLKCLQRRRARIEENATNDSGQMENSSNLAEFNEQIRNVTAQLESVQDSIQECQASIIEFEKCESNTSKLTGNKQVKSQDSRQNLSSCSNNQSNNVHAVFSSCTLSEARFLLTQLFEAAVSRGLLAARLQQREIQLQASLSMKEQEREQELELIKLAMQNAGISPDCMGTVFSINEPPFRKPFCPHNGKSNITGYECCPYTLSSAPISSEDSSDELQNEDNQIQTYSNILSNQNRFPMSSSMYANMEPSKYDAQEASGGYGALGSASINGSDAGNKALKTKRRLVQGEETAGVSSSSFIQTSQSVCDVMPPPSSTLRRPRTVLNISSNTVANNPSALRSSCPPSAVHSPTTRRNVTIIDGIPNSAPSNLQLSTARSAIGNVGNVPNVMSTSLILQPINNTDSVSAESRPTSPTSKTAPIASLCLMASEPDDVFNRLTSGMSNSPNPTRGSIRPLTKLNTPSLISANNTNTNLISNTNTSNQSYHLSSSSLSQCSNTLTDLGNNLSSQSISQPLASFSTSFTISHAAHANVNGSHISSNMNTTSSSTAHSSSLFPAPIECTHVAKGHSNAVLDVDVLNSIMITGSKDRTAKIWDLNTMEEVDTFHDHPNNVTKVRMCQRSNLIFTVCSYFIKVWDRRDSRKCIRTLLYVKCVNMLFDFFIFLRQGNVLMWFSLLKINALFHPPFCFRSSGLSQEGSFETKAMRRQNICPPGETNIMDITLGGPSTSLSHLMFSATANSVKLWDLRRFYCVGKLHGSHQAPVMVLAAAQNSLSPTDISEPRLTVVTGSKVSCFYIHSISIMSFKRGSSGQKYFSFR
ncbi:unnamed protein product [Trichobilharzia szidati]|nr:unnamed protein product [Trichobilharzia szidati]